MEAGRVVLWLRGVERARERGVWIGSLDTLRLVGIASRVKLSRWAFMLL